MKPLLFTALLATTLASTTTMLHAEEDAERVYVVRTLRVDNTELAIIRLHTRTGLTWQLERDEWVPIPPPRQIDSGSYDCALTPVGKSSWILTLWNTRNGQAYIYASATKGWRFARDRDLE